MKVSSDSSFKKLVHSNLLEISKPGIIMNSLSGKYGNNKNGQRSVYFFEENISDLQKNTYEALGDRSHDLWRIIGRKVGARYLLLANVQQGSKPLTSLIIKDIFSGFVIGGLSLARNISINKSEEEIIFSGESNMICRKSLDVNFFIGIIQEILYFISGKRFECKSYCKSCPDHCRLVFSLSSKKYVSINYAEIAPLNSYYNKNFSNGVNPPGSSFNDLMNFNKVCFNKSGRLTMDGLVILPSENGWMNLIAFCYEEIGERVLFVKLMTASCEKIASIILREYDTIQEKIKALVSRLMALGWGDVFIQRKGKNCLVNIKNCPFSRFGYLYQVAMFRGFLNYIFKKNCDFVSISTTSCFLKISYSIG